MHVVQLRAGSRRRATLSIVGAVMLAAPTLALASPAAASNPPFYYGQYYSTSSSPLYGMDGYIRPSTSVPLSGDEERANLFSLDNGSNYEWVQIGTYQGDTLDSINYYSVDIYTEGQSSLCGESYFFHDWGGPATANEAYYVWNDGNIKSGCGGAHEFAFRKATWSSSPFDYGKMSVSSAVGTAGTELHHDPGDTVPEGNEYYGTNDSHEASGSNGIHVENDLSGAWVLWGSLQVTSPSSDNPPTMHTLDRPWAFYTSP